MHVRGRRAWALSRIATQVATQIATLSAAVLGLVATAWRVLIACFAPRRGAHRVAQPAAELQRVAAAKALLAGGDPSGLDPGDPTELLPYGDFSSAAEAERFSALPPIAPEAAEDVDWDELARDLTRRA